MNKSLFFITIMNVFSALASVHAKDSVTPEEIISKVRSAATYLSKEGADGLANFNRASSEYVWKDSYVFVYNCDGDIVAAHPVTESRGVSITGLTDGNGKAFGTELCKAAETPNGSWAEYQWPRPTKERETDNLAYTGQPIRKVSYMLAVDVDGTPYQVGAGMFDETTNLHDLNALLSK